MNKTLLLIICDFLLISVLALVEFEPSDETDPLVSAQIEEGVSEDLMELLQNSLEIEAIEREQLEEERAELASNLNQTEAERAQLSSEKSSLLEEKSALEEDRERLAREKAETSDKLESTAAELELTARERERLAKESATLAVAKASLTENLQTQTAQAKALQSSLDEQEAALRAREAELQAAQAVIDETKAEAARLSAERATLATSLEVAQTERAQLDQNLQLTRDELNQTRADRVEAERRASQLASDLTTIAESSEALQAEIRASQPLSSNEIFRRYEQNRIRISMTAEINGLLGTREQTENLDAVVINANNQRYIIFEESRAPFRINNLDQVVSLNGAIMVDGRRLPITRLGFLATDPRLIVIELMPTSDPARLDETFNLSNQPFRFPQAVLISHTLGAYGLTDFRLLPGGEGYVGVDRNLINQLTGEFQPSRGDYIFAQSGELLGLMVEPERGVLLDDLRIEASLPIGDEFSPGNAKAIQSRLEAN